MSGKVWRDYTQEELDANYNQASLVPNSEEYSERNLARSEEVRAKVPHEAGIPYGPSLGERLDVFPADNRGGPVAVYCHGGAWARTSKEHYSFLAPAFNAAGVHFVVLGFNLAPKVSLDEIVRQCRAGIAWVHRNGDAYGWDGGDLHVIGHSSGGHICGMMLVTDWEGEYGLPANLIKSGAPMSGMFDLEPVRLSHRNTYLDLTEKSALRNSSIHHIPERACPIVNAWGTGELAEFQRQNREFAQAWRDAGHPVEEIVLEGYNHFEVCAEIADADGRILPAILSNIGIPRAAAAE